MVRDVEPFCAAEWPHRAAPTNARTRSWSLIPGAVSKLELASTAQGRVAAIAARTFSGPSPPASTRRPSTARARSRWPGSSSSQGRSTTVAEQHRVTTANAAVLALVYLDEIGAALDRVANEDRDREDAVGNGQNRAGRTRACRLEDEPAQVGPCVYRVRDVPFPRQAADLDQRPRGDLP